MSQPPPPPCANCGCTDIQRYCPRCGQENEPSAVPLNQVLRDILEEFVRFDTKLWTTLRTLLQQPGRITREYLQGRRAAWVSPVKLFLALLFVQAVLRSLAPGWFDVSDIERQSAGLRKGYTLVGMLLPALPKPTEAEPTVRQPASERDDGCADEVNKAVTEAVAKALKVRSKREQERSRTAWLTGNATTMAMARIPLFAALFAMLYRRQSRYYIEHVIFALHLQSAVTLIETGGAVVGGLGIPLAGFAAGIGALVYAFRAMQTVYRDKRGRTIAATVGFFLAGQMLDTVAGVGAGIIYRLIPPA